jgi:diketogulonate reductase-like aldo/keto reductase
MIKKSDDYVCKVCGSNNIMVEGWINLNEDTISRHDIKYKKTLCEQCNVVDQGIILRWLFEEVTGLKSM